MQTTYPWQQQQWQQLINCAQHKKLAHAILLTGPQGLGKAEFAIAFANYLLCEQPKVAACGQCRHCQWNKANTHPDLTIISPEQDSNRIKIDQIRQLVEDANKTSQQARYKIYIINPVEAMNMAAANALLKTLEEPSANTLFLLINHQLSALPATIRSRCQMLSFNAPSATVAINWLQQYTQNLEQATLVAQLAECVPLVAYQFIQSDYLNNYYSFIDNFIRLSTDQLTPVSMAALYTGETLDTSLNILWKILLDLARIKVKDTTNVMHSQKLTKLTNIDNSVSTEQLFSFIDHINHLRKLNLSKINLNVQLTLEELFITWHTIIHQH